MDLGWSCKVNACPDITSTWRIKSKLALNKCLQLSKNKCLQVPKQCHAMKSRPALVLGLVEPMRLWPIKISFSIESFVIDPQSPGLRFFGFFIFVREREQRKQPKKNKTRRLGRTVKLRPNLSILIPHYLFDINKNFWEEE